MFQDCTMAGSDKAPRAIAHIGCLISVLVDRAALSFCIRSPDSFIHFRRPGLSR
jgi:hypothetical protein